MLIEIVDTLSGQSVADGDYGELVFTSLSAQGMPLIRYRTGDISRIIPEPCPCGTMLKSVDIISKRVNGKIMLASGQYFWLCELDEVLFSLNCVLNFQVTMNYEGEHECINLMLDILPPYNHDLIEIAETLIRRVPAIDSAKRSGKLTINIQFELEPQNRVPSKRTILDLRNKEG